MAASSSPGHTGWPHSMRHKVLNRLLMFGQMTRCCARGSQSHTASGTHRVYATKLSKPNEGSGSVPTWSMRMYLILAPSGAVMVNCQPHESRLLGVGALGVQKRMVPSGDSWDTSSVRCASKAVTLKCSVAFVRPSMSYSIPLASSVSPSYVTSRAGKPSYWPSRSCLGNRRNTSPKVPRWSRSFMPVQLPPNAVWTLSLPTASRRGRLG
mmetsp:Transcript_64545/g.106926  ORF Transcript_64545/g.106926 Transcript_64545/m.106926 type:complete len:210 (-) Transcript_64545:360-989(-)